MLDILAQGKKPEGAARRPTQTAQALAGYLLTLTSPKTLTVREAAAILDRDVRSVKTAVGALKGYGVSISIVDDFIKFFPDTAAPIRTQEPELDFLEAPPIEGELVEFDTEFGLEQQESVEDQLSLFGGYYQTQQPKAVDYADFPVVAACSVRQPREQKNKIPEPETDAAAQDLRKPCANFVQSLNKPCTELVQDVQRAGHEGLAAAMERLAATLDGKPGNISAQADAPVPARPRVSKEKQESIYNQSTKEKPEEPSVEFKLSSKPREQKIKIPGAVPKFDAAERESRRREILQKLPKLATPESEHVVGTLANMMAYGTMPESVYYQTLRDAAEPTVCSQGAFLNFKVQELKKIYRYKK